MDGKKLFKTAQFFGLECEGTSGDERICLCVLCGKERHLYYNVEKNVGHCKVCDAVFKPMDLLAPLIEDMDDLMPAELNALAEDRQLPKKAFEQSGVRFVDGWYILPVYGIDGKLASVRRYRPGKVLQICGGCPAVLFNAVDLGDDERVNEPVYVCEGEWDAIALAWLLGQATKPGVVVAVPGAGIFKPSWTPWFKRRTVRLLYDNDEAGRNGMAKAVHSLLRVTRDIQTLHWPEDTEEGFDVRDFVIQSLRKEPANG